MQAHPTEMMEEMIGEYDKKDAETDPLVGPAGRRSGRPGSRKARLVDARITKRAGGTETANCR
jgi:hypothetical protein